MCSRVFRALLWIGLLVSSRSLLSAHQTEKTAVITFEVKDPGEAVIPGAHIKLVPVTGTAAKQLETDNSGEALLDMAPGTYNLEVTSPGFRRASKKIEVQEGKGQTISLVLQVWSCPPEPCLVDPSLAPEFKITISTMHEIVKTGSKIMVDTRFTNDNSRTPVIPKSKEAPDIYFKIKVLDSQGRQAPLTTSFRAKLKRKDFPLDSLAYNSIGYGEIARKQMVVTDQYDLSAPDKYSIQVDWINWNGLTQVKSNIVTVTVTK